MAVKAAYAHLDPDSPQDSRVSWHGSLLRFSLAVALASTLAALAVLSSPRSFRRSIPRQQQGLIREFGLLETYKTLAQGDPFRFHCPLPFFAEAALEGMDQHTALRSCCHDYNALPLQWPYQFRECESNCSSCWKQSGEPKLPKHPVAGLAAAGYAASVAVSGPRNISQNNLARRLGTTRHAGLPFKQIIGSVQNGMRGHYSNLCPQINDWEEYYLSDDLENTHARIYRSAGAKLAIVAFRGTQAGSGKNWQTDADIVTRPITLEDGVVASVHQGFLVAVQRVLPHVRKWVEGYAVGVQGMWQVPQDWKLLFTGHSLGGALATLAATLAEVEGWSRKPDAVVTFGAPRVADGNLSSWWEARGLCGKILRVNVYNDIVHWTPFTMGYELLDSLFSCATHPKGCVDSVHNGLHESITHKVEFSQRWTHVCPGSEFLVPGAVKGVNLELEDFSPLGGVLAHFLSNAVFGYGYGMVYGGLLLHDEHCGITPAVFPGPHCSAAEDLTGVRCMGLEHDEGAADPDACKRKCCDDPFCEVWQAMSDGSCWRGRSHQCSATDPQARSVVISQRLH